MATVNSKTLFFKKVPEGMIKPNVDMVLQDQTVPLTPPPKGMIVKTLVIGFDPHMRDRMRGPEVKSYVPGYVPNEPMNTFGVAKVIKSDHERFADGDLVAGVMPIGEYGVIPKEVSPRFRDEKVVWFILWRVWTGDADGSWQLIEAKPMAAHMIDKIENKYNLDLGNWVGPLGLAGMTAWVSRRAMPTWSCQTQD